MAPSRRTLGLLLLGICICTIVYLSSLGGGPAATYGRAPSPAKLAAVHPDTLTGHAIAPKLGNETAKAELGRAAWKLFHTTMARFPEAPTEDEQTALRSYVHLFQRLYPCGECAEHFGQLLARYPPQVATRNAAVGWACHVHNKVNESLDKEIFDCSKIGDFYDCGCADDEELGSLGDHADGKKRLKVDSEGEQRRIDVAEKLRSEAKE